MRGCAGGGVGGRQEGEQGEARGGVGRGRLLNQQKDVSGSVGSCGQIGEQGEQGDVDQQDSHPSAAYDREPTVKTDS